MLNNLREARVHNPHAELYFELCIVQFSVDIAAVVVVVVD